MKNSPIGVFDSGIGGLSIFLKLIAFLPHENFIYLADEKNCPYGDKKPEEIKKIALKNTQFFLKQKCKLVVLACNTSTTLTINYLRKKFPQISFVGIVPPIKPAVKKSKTGHIAILSTRATQKSEYLKGLIKRFGSGKKIYNLSCPGLVEIIEKGKIKGEEINTLLKKCLKSVLKDKEVDIIVGGCTHYYFIDKTILSLFPQKIEFIETSLPVTKQVKRLLKTKNLFSSERKFLKIYTTGSVIKFEKAFENLCRFKIRAKKVKL